MIKQGTTNAGRHELHGRPSPLLRAPIPGGAGRLAVGSGDGGVTDATSFGITSTLAPAAPNHIERVVVERRLRAPTLSHSWPGLKLDSEQPKAPARAKARRSDTSPGSWMWGRPFMTVAAAMNGRAGSVRGRPARPAGRAVVAAPRARAPAARASRALAPRRGPEDALCAAVAIVFTPVIRTSIGGSPVQMNVPCGPGSTIKVPVVVRPGVAACRSPWPSPWPTPPRARSRRSPRGASPTAPPRRTSLPPPNAVLHRRADHQEERPQHEDAATPDRAAPGEQRPVDVLDPPLDGPLPDGPLLGGVDAGAPGAVPSGSFEPSAAR